jgi:hypothetical protein
VAGNDGNLEPSGSQIGGIEDPPIGRIGQEVPVPSESNRTEYQSVAEEFGGPGLSSIRRPDHESASHRDAGVRPHKAHAGQGFVDPGIQDRPGLSAIQGFKYAAKGASGIAGIGTGEPKRHQVPGETLGFHRPRLSGIHGLDDPALGSRHEYRFRVDGGHREPFPGLRLRRTGFPRVPAIAGRQDSPIAHDVSRIYADECDVSKVYRGAAGPLGP